MYRVIKAFTDLQDGDHAYAEGDTYPRNGLTVSDARLAELSEVKNRQRTPLIEAVVAKSAPAEKRTEEEKPKTAAKKGTKK